VISLWLPVAIWMGAIYWGAALPIVPSPVKGLSDTVMHIGGYGGLALLLLRAFAGGRWAGVTPRTLLLAGVVALIHGLTVEWEQMYVPSRFAEWRDVGNDAIGAILGLMPAWAWSKMRGSA
jgi:VanZ family protein